MLLLPLIGLTLVASSTYNDAMQWGQSVVEVAFVTHFPIPPIYPYLPFTPGYLNIEEGMPKFVSNNLGCIAVHDNLLINPLSIIYSAYTCIFDVFRYGSQHQNKPSNQLFTFGQDQKFQLMVCRAFLSIIGYGKICRCPSRYILSLWWVCQWCF